MGELVQKVTTELSFTKEGVLVPPGTIITVDADHVSDRNLADVAGAPVNVAVAVAPIAPTGPNPTMPQQIPPGAFQTTAGYADGSGSMLVGAGGVLAPLEDTERAELNRLRAQVIEMANGSTATAEGDEFTPTKGARDFAAEHAERRKEMASEATLVQSAGGFNPDGLIDGTVPDVTAKLDGLTREQLVQVKAAEDDREVPRAGVKNAIDARITALDEQNDI